MSNAFIPALNQPMAGGAPAPPIVPLDVPGSDLEKQRLLQEAALERQRALQQASLGVGFNAAGLPTAPAPSPPPPAAVELARRNALQQAALGLAPDASGLPVAPPAVRPPPSPLGGPIGGPGAAQLGGIPAPQGPAPAQLMPYPSAAPGATSSHAVGLSAADKRRQAELSGEGVAEAESAQALMAHQQELAAERAKTTDILAKDTDLATQQWQKQQADLAARQALHVQKDKENQARIDKQLADLEGQGIDPHRYWQRAGTAGTILAAIAVGMGAFASSGLGANGHATENTALKIINGAVQDDIDAQKTNLLHRINLAKTRADLSEKGFNHEEAVLNAEKESIQTGYTVAMNTVAKKASLYGDNANAQQFAATTIAGLAAHRDAALDAKNKEKYELDKAAERVVTTGGAGGKSLEQRIRERTAEIDKENRAAGLDIPLAQTQRRAAMIETGKDFQPGAEPMPSMAKPGKGGPGGKMSPRLITKMGELESAEKSVNALKTILGSGPESGNRIFDPQHAAVADAAANELRKLGYTTVPEHPLELFSRQGARLAGLAEVQKQIDTKKRVILSGGASGADEPTAESEGLSKDE